MPAPFIEDIEPFDHFEGKSDSFQDQTGTPVDKQSTADGTGNSSAQPDPNGSGPAGSTSDGLDAKAEDLSLKSGVLTEDQEDAYDRVSDRLARGERFTGLFGYAGTGKTFLVTRLVEQLVRANCPVTVCAPTHKAVQVLREELEADVQMCTLHSYLGLKLEPGDNGEYQLVPDEDRDFVEGVVIVDEASMVGREEWAYIQESPFWVQWLFVGDPAQLPPVNEEDSPALDVPGPTLETVHRQAKDNPILELATQIRNRTLESFSSTYRDGKGVGCTDDHESFLQSIVRAFESDRFEEDATHARVLAYRNRRVRYYNDEIRQRRLGADAERFVEGEWLVGTETWYDDGTPKLINSEEVRVRKAEVSTFTAPDQSEWKTWSLKVDPLGRGGKKTIDVLHEDEEERYQNALERRRKKAEEDGSKWKRFFNLRERFARVDYAYATTVHRSQGSTFNTVFVDNRDLCACQGREENALRYVAVTRPSQRLALLV